jgi:hypothetical protein
MMLLSAIAGVASVRYIGSINSTERTLLFRSVTNPQ